MPSFHPRPISISLSPNVQMDDVFVTLKLLLGIRTKETGTKELENTFREYQNAKYAFSFNSGRSALYTIMKALDIKEGDEVLVQAFTCNAVPNPVLWTGGIPVYVDIDESLNIDPADLEKKITQRSRAVVVQHTLGIPAQVDKILEIAKRHNLIVIEDCAHALGAEYKVGLPAEAQRAKVGTFGDIAFFSFGRDKIISSVWGGMITTNDEGLAQRIGEIYTGLPYPSRSWSFKQLLHPLLFSLIIPTYYIFGKYFLAFLRVVRGVGLAVSKLERVGERPSMFPARMPETFAALALHQFEKLEKYNAHRREMAKIYFENIDPSYAKLPVRNEGAIYLRFNIRHPNAKQIIQQAKRQHILLGDWYKNIIDPIGTDFNKMRYTPSSCPNAERAARESVNLPTHINISTKDAHSIIDFLKINRHT